MVTYCYARDFSNISVEEQIEKMSGYSYQKLWIDSQKINDSTQLEEMLNDCTCSKRKHTVIVTHLAVFGKPFFQLHKLFQFFNENKIRLVSLHEGIDTEVNQEIYHIYDTFAQVHRNIKKKNAVDAINEKKEEGVVLGRPKVSENSIEAIYSLYKAGYTYRHIATSCGLSVGTVHNYVSKYKKEAS